MKSEAFDDGLMTVRLPTQKSDRCRRAIRVGALTTLLIASIMVLHLIAPLNKQPTSRFHALETHPSGGCSGPKRSYKRHEAFLPISGKFELYDELDLSTTAGSINIVVVPRPGCGPSVLKLHSEAGSISVSLVSKPEPVDVVFQNPWTARPHEGLSASTSKHPTDRPIIADIATKAGSIHTLIQAGSGSSISLSSVYGSISSTFDVHSDGPNGTVTRIRTSTTAGNQDVRVVPSPCFRKDCPKLDRIEASHIMTGYGNMRLTYSSQWRGNVHAKTEGTGLVEVSGEKLHYTLRSDREVFAWRGQHGYQGNTIEAISKGAGSIVFNADGRSSSPASDAHVPPFVSTMTSSKNQQDIDEGDDSIWRHGYRGDWFTMHALMGSLQLPWVLFGSCMIAVSIVLLVVHRKVVLF